MIILLVSSATLALSGFADSDDQKFLLNGVSQIAAPGMPGAICVFGDQAFPVVAGESDPRAPVVAAARFGKGRVVAFGHTGYFDAGTLKIGETGRLFANAARWAAAKTQETDPAPRVATIGQGGLTDWLRAQKFSAENLGGNQWWERLDGFDVVCHRLSGSSPAEIEALTMFVKNGGGLIVTETPWGWLQGSGGRDLPRGYPGTPLMAAAGLAWSDAGLGRTSKIGFEASSPPSDFCHAGRSLDALLAHDKGEKKLKPDALKLIQSTLLTACRFIPETDVLLRPKLRRALETARRVPMAKRPLTVEKDALDRLALTYQLENAERQSPALVKAHPAGSEFPGATPPDAPTVYRKLDLDTGIPDWHSTGLYAPAGKTISVGIPDTAIGKGLRVRIGCHADQLWGKDAWHRAPRVTRTFALEKQTTLAASAFGGLVYIEVPRNSKLGTIPVSVNGCIAAPWFVLGKTSVEDWRKTIRAAPAPWAELECSSIIYSVPSSAIRNLDDPKTLMEIWDSQMNSFADLAGIPRQRVRPERFVLDEQISAGYMHSGYPIMAHLDAVYSVDITAARKGLWGNLHEIGHNHQIGDWTFHGTGEVTNNIFVLYALDAVCGSRKDAHGNIAPGYRLRRTREYFTDAPDFEKWQSDPFLALYLYMHLQEAFGWDTFKKIFAEYRALPADQRPKNDDEKRDQWMTRFSRAVGRNLGPYFETWRVPTSAKARESVAHLPAWMPPNFPPKTPTAFIRQWKLASITEPWTDHSKFVAMDAAKLAAIVTSAATGNAVQSATDKINLLPMLPADRRENVAAYCVQKFVSTKSQAIKLWTGSDDTLRLWLNGKLITEVLEMRGVEFDSESTDAVLLTGENTLVVEIGNGGGAAGFCLRMEDAAGNELKISPDGKLVFAK